MVYPGQPDYVKAGFLKDILEPWAHIEGSEWGEWTRSLHDAADAAIRIGDEMRAQILLDWLMEEIVRSMDEDDPFLQREYEEEVAAAQAEYEPMVQYWRERAKSFNGPDGNASKLLEETIAALPEFFKPVPPESQPEFLATPF